VQVRWKARSEEQLEPARLMDRYSALFIALAAALWASDAYFRPALARQLSASQIVLVESLLISLCFLPVAGRVIGELRAVSWRTWLALAVIAAGPQAFATVLFTRSIGYAYTVPAAESGGVLSEVDLLYLLQPVFGVTMAWLFLRERRKPSFWPLAALALVGAALIVFASNAYAPRAQLLAAGFVLGAVILWAAGTVLGRYALAGVSFTSTSAMRFTLALPILLILMLTDRGASGISQYSIGQLPSFLGIALIPGLIAMLLLPGPVQHSSLDLERRRARAPGGPLPGLLPAASGRLRIAAPAARDHRRGTSDRRRDQPQLLQAA